MFKKFMYITILGSSLFLQADSKIVYNQPSKISIEIEEAQAYKEIFLNSQTISEKKIVEQLSENRVFAKQFLKQNNMTKQEKIAIDIAIEEILAKAYIEQYKQKHQPSQKEIQSFYLDHIDSFKPAEKISVSSIVTDSLAKADKIYLKIQKNPASFDEIAQKESLEPASITFKDVAITTFFPTIRDWIREHKVKDISEPLNVGRFYYIDRLDAKTQESVSYESLKEEIKKLLSNIYLRNRLNNHYKELKESYTKDIEHD